MQRHLPDELNRAKTVRRKMLTTFIVALLGLEVG
jgi:hypothetical protein